MRSVRANTCFCTHAHTQTAGGGKSDPFHQHFYAGMKWTQTSGSIKQVMYRWETWAQLFHRSFTLTFMAGRKCDFITQKGSELWKSMICGLIKWYFCILIRTVMQSIFPAISYMHFLCKENPFQVLLCKIYSKIIDYCNKIIIKNFLFRKFRWSVASPCLFTLFQKYTLSLK